MKPLYFSLFISFIGIHCSAQETPANSVYTTVDIHAAYSGDSEALQRYLGLHLHYPFDARHNEIQGTVIVQGPTEGRLREEAVRVIQQSGKWKPAIADGHKVTTPLRPDTEKI